MADRRLHVHGRRAEADLAAVVAAEGGDELAVGHGDAGEALEKVDVEEGAPELAVGDALQAGVLLALHHRADAVVLDLPEPGVVQPAAGMLLARLGEAARAQEAADVVGAEGRSLGHRSEEHTSELQSLMRISYAVFCL